VTAANTMPISHARVRLIGTDLATVTRVDGAFQVAQVPTGRQTLEITMLGYTPKVMAVDIAAGATLYVSLALEPLALEPVKVTGDASFSPGLGGFEERRARGNGRYFTRADIERMQARQVTDVLRRVPGMQIHIGSGAFSGGSQTAQTGRNVGGASRTCPMAYYVNGAPFRVSNDVPINHYVAPDDVAGIEVYTGASQIPPQFNSSMFNSRCGVVVIWTRNSLEPRASH
jgi:carboxypeptidase-like protein/TonB-dependent receptor-like protein